MKWTTYWESMRVKRSFIWSTGESRSTHTSLPVIYGEVEIPGTWTRQALVCLALETDRFPSRWPLPSLALGVMD